MKDGGSQRSGTTDSGSAETGGNSPIFLRHGGNYCDFHKTKLSPHNLFSIAAIETRPALSSAKLFLNSTVSFSFMIDYSLFSKMPPGGPPVAQVSAVRIPRLLSLASPAVPDQLLPAGHE
jgi:hypothetical protein